MSAVLRITLLEALRRRTVLALAIATAIIVALSGWGSPPRSAPPRRPAADC